MVKSTRGRSRGKLYCRYIRRKAKIAWTRSFQVQVYNALRLLLYLSSNLFFERIRLNPADRTNAACHASQHRSEFERYQSLARRSRILWSDRLSWPNHPLNPWPVCLQDCEHPCLCDSKRACKSCITTLPGKCLTIDARIWVFASIGQSCDTT